MSTSVRKPLPPSPTGRRPSTDALSNGSPSRGSSKSPTPPTTSNTNGLTRSPSIRQSPVPVSARAAARKPGARSNLSLSNVPRITPDWGFDDDARAESAALIEELKEQLQKAETASEQYQKQLSVLQTRLDEAMSEQGALEDQAHEKDSKIEALQVEVRDNTRQRREMEQAQEADRVAMTQEKEQQASREEEMQSTIQRLKESVAQKDMRMNVEGDRTLTRSPSFRNRSSPDLENGRFAPSSQLQRSPSRANSKLIMQKDKLIESLRLELAESQIKLVEMENMGDGRSQELERTLLETRMANARLMEDNESFQLLLSEKTLNGDFAKADFMQESASVEKPSGLGSLADELESAGEGESENYRRLEAEAKSLRDQNKALTLYIERIIGRLLQHEGFETILDKSENPLSAAPKPANKDKALPPPPTAKEEPAGPSFLQRARSVVAGPGNRPTPKPKIRPMSHMPPPTIESVPTPHEDPNTAPSIPLGRTQPVRQGLGHRRSRSDQADPSAAAVVGQMYRGPSFGRTASGGAMSPGISPSMSSSVTTPRQNPYFANTPNNTAANPTPSGGRVPSGSGLREEHGTSSSNSVMSDRSGEVGSTGGSPSPPRSNAGGPSNNFTGAVMTQSKLRPLRLVQENRELEAGDQGRGLRSADVDDVEARKKANRGSWMGWFRGAAGQDEVPKSAAL